MVIEALLMALLKNMGFLCSKALNIRRGKLNTCSLEDKENTVCLKYLKFDSLLTGPSWQ